MIDASDQIINFRLINERLTISGQPSEDQLATLRGDGVETIINLGLHSHERALPDQAASCAALGLHYIHIPVAFDAPTEADYAAFCEAMITQANRRLHVHCIINARVTAFLFRYGPPAGLMTSAQAAMLLDSVWRPGGVWAAFIGDDIRLRSENEFCGRDYGLQ